MDGLVLLIIYVAGFATGGVLFHRSEEECKPLPVLPPPVELMVEPPTLWLLPTGLRGLPLTMPSSSNANPPPSN